LSIKSSSLKLPI